MADGKQTIIIKKKKGGGHGAPHGGAWKVALADFMTAMMTFFLVMWLLGSDEEIQSAVAEYFNNPASAWRPDLASKDNFPLGEMTGAGNDVLNGANGQIPENMVDSPGKEYKHTIAEGSSNTKGDADELSQGLKAPVKIEIEILKFTIPEYELFREGTDELTNNAVKALNRLVYLANGFKGELTIKGFTYPPPTAEAVITDPYEFAISRTVAIQKFLVGRKIIDENRTKTVVADTSRTIASDVDDGTPKKTRKLMFVFKR